MQPEPPDHSNLDAEPPSKSARKRAHKALQDLGSELMNLTASQLARIPLREDLREVVTTGQQLRKGARSRHVRHLGNLLAQVDDALIRGALESLRGPTLADAARLHRAERWRERLIEPGDEAVHEFICEFPQVDRQQLRALIRTARDERAKQAPTRRFRELLRFVRALDEIED
ncbi:MAG: ribosome-associated protein [Gammaproteobacteria bacterium]|jgi:ribosome-associated protein